MATDDVTTIKRACPCGNGQLTITQSMPDHPWVRASQISYHAQLNCDVCEQGLVVVNEFGGYKPRLVKRAQFEARAAAEGKAITARAGLEACEGLAKIREALVALLDAQPSKAARHRLAGKLGFYPRSYGTFIKGAATGESIVQYSSAQTLLEAGLRAGLPDAQQHEPQLRAVDELQKVARNIAVETVETGSNWMAA